MTPKFTYRGIVALCGGLALFAWGIGVALGTGIGYDRPIVSLIPVTGRVLWQLFKGGCLITMAVAVVKEAIEAADSRAQVKFLNESLMETEKRHTSDRSDQQRLG
jgi:hypothetical protein